MKQRKDRQTASEVMFISHPFITEFLYAVLMMN